MPHDESREIASGIWWLGGCLEAGTSTGPVHYHVSCYLVIGDEKAVLIDSGDPAHETAVIRGLAKALNGRKLDFILPTHPEIPHAGNIPALVEAYPEVRIVGDVRDYHLHWPDVVSRLEPLVAGDRIDLGGRTLEVVPAHIRDLHNTLWAFDTAARMLFVSDGFAFIHELPPGELEDDEPIHRQHQCRLMSSEMPSVAVSVDAAAYGAGRSLYWTRFVDVSAAFDEIEGLISTNDVRLIGPAHGAVIDDVTVGLRIAIGAHRQVFRESSSAIAPVVKKVGD